MRERESECVSQRSEGERLRDERARELIEWVT